MSLRAFALVVPLVVAPMLSLTALAAGRFTSEALRPTDVPEAVATAHRERYAVPETRWKKNTWTNDQGKTVTVYVAWFNQKRFAHRAAYTPEGEGYLTIRYLGGARGLPKAVTYAVSKALPDHRIAAAQRYDAHTTNLTAYRVVLRKGGTKVVKWTDGEGKPITKDDLPDAVDDIGR